MATVAVGFASRVVANNNRTIAAIATQTSTFVDCPTPAAASTDAAQRSVPEHCLQACHCLVLLSTIAAVKTAKGSPGSKAAAFEAGIARNSLETCYQEAANVA